MTAQTIPAQAQQPLPAQMYDMLNAHMLVQALHVAATLRIADFLAEGSSTVEELAQASSSDRASLYRLLRMLAGAGVFAEEASGRFKLTPLGSTLRTDTPDSVRDWALFIAAPPVWTAWSNLLHSVQTGESAFEHTYGMRLFSYMTDHPELGAAYNNWMAKQSALQNGAVLASYDFSGQPKVVDVGGGQGATLAAILQANPQARGVLFDLPQVVSNVTFPESIARRSEVVGGDMLESLPAGGDVYILKRVLMDWSDEIAVRALRNCRDAMTESGKVLVIEPIVAEGNEPSVSRFLDMTMLVMQGGGLVRTQDEHRALFEAAGLQLTRMIPTASPLRLVEGVRRI
jgi:O-methyltransferase domain